VILFVQGGAAVSLFRLFDDVWPLVVYLQAGVYLHFLSLVRPRPRPLVWRVLVSIPASGFAAGTILALPWALIAALGFDPWVPWLPFALAAVGVFQSLYTREEEVDLVLDGEVVGDVRRHPRGKPNGEKPLRVVQITDPHIGPFMSPQRLARICRRAVERSPDLILLTGDFLTMESQADPALLERALAPLAAAKGKTFACFGNHDHEAPELVRNALASAGVTLLVDEEAIVQTDRGPVQLLGMDFTWRGRREHMAALCERFPRREGHLRVVLLHDPGAFRHLPDGHGDIVFSGHTHGGQVGLVSLGLTWTFLSALTSMPDHGLWARGRDRLYVHRGTGHYGFPLRLGVPAERSVINLYFPSPR
jgi:predicted MPP superfamily phosphohydrolase